ncbi:hypothetical protein LCX93_12045 [Sulfurimonas sp. SWIR-19]|uniref:hypothetical protein n=1 Tax=Sulfurimonas sp. SWIR-19 TaxID=2878390 RepID=UPI001CF5F21A|nr:hypothetical protein [Sulfurimonas sp. SWIR-19]UCN00236.1 hypothetical protein LCX93_12045 [Sulfurimonas sp. SWIR-19]
MMCIPHSGAGTVSQTFVKEKKPKKHIQKPSKEMLEKGDPDFVDERTSSYKPKKKGSFFDDLFS